ncbi:sensor histidine kinase [Frankia sp. AgB32]|uniref:sensor histidine kinase n=1 Tax=Frankia sp. AgB32 TaxID=631119 RepID=UPI00200C3EE8|nr:sensor histidine kinase [Frankia sp. AgB32]MCK9895265.1 sensor histidine kinase [Frankia sp. AgB32]
MSVETPTDAVSIPAPAPPPAVAPARSAVAGTVLSAAEAVRSGQAAAGSMVSPAAVAWQTRSDRIARRLVLPTLAVSVLLTVITLPELDAYRSHLRVGVPVAVVAVVWSLGLLGYPVVGVPLRTRRIVFSVHLALAAVLVWADPWFGVFAFTGYFFADELGRRGRIIGFTATALVLAGSQTAGYPNGSVAHTVTYLIMGGFNVVAVLSMVRLMNRVLEQNIERGHMIAELAEANDRLRTTMDENVGLHAQLLTQAREAGVAEERSRLAGEIHDTLAQGFAGIITQLEAARRAGVDPAEHDRHLELADGLARDNLTEARRSVRALRPEQLEQASLPEALAKLTRDWTLRAQLPADVVTTGETVRAAAEIETAVFRIAQEALANVARHAQATRARLTLTYLDDTLLLDVADDGSGFHPSAGPPPGRFGLTGMRRRAESLAGTLSVESTPGEGTTINATFPLTDPSTPLTDPPTRGAEPAR